MDRAQMDHPETEVPELLVERYRFGELDPVGVEQLESPARSRGLAARLQDLDIADREARRTYPPSELSADVRQRLATEPRARRHVRLWLAPAAAAAAVVMALGAGLWPAPDRGSERGTDAQAGERVKGPAGQLFIYRNTEHGAERLVDGDMARTGQVLRIGYRVTAEAFGAIVSVDGRGHVTQHLPSSGHRAVALTAGDAVLLDSGFELDDAPRVERFFLVTASAPFDLTPLLARVGGAVDASPIEERALGLPSGATATAFAVVKGEEPR